MGPVLSVAEMRTRYNGEWILVGDPQTDSTLGVQAGKVLSHSADRDEVYRQAAALRPARFAVLCFAVPPADTAIVL
jgi:hypothetical protein